MKLQINTKLYHPCSLDIIEFKITGIRQYEDSTLYEAKALDNVGACGRVEVLLKIDKYDVIRFIGINDSYDDRYGKGLEDFVEGKYYLEKLEARLEHNEQQLSLCRTSMENQRRVYETSKNMYDKVEKIVQNIKNDLKLIKGLTWLLT